MVSVQGPVRDSRYEPALMQLLERAAKHDEAVDRGEAEPFTRKRLTS